MRDQLFLLRAGFPDPAVGAGLFYCPDCIRVEGLLASFPALRAAIDVVYLDFPRPRAALLALLGEAGQGCPVLVAGAAGADTPGLELVNGRRVARDAAPIAAYLAARYGIPLPHP